MPFQNHHHAASAGFYQVFERYRNFLERKSDSTRFYDYILGILIICGIQALAFAFFTVWKDKEKRPRTRLFVPSFFLCTLGGTLATFLTKYAFSTTIGSTLIFFLFSLCYNFIEYIALIFMIDSFITHAFFLSEPIKGIIGLIAFVGIIIFVWNRKQYLELYKYVFTVVMAFTSFVGSLIFKRMKSQIPFYVVFSLSIASASYISYIGWTKKALNSANSTNDQNF